MQLLWGLCSLHWRLANHMSNVLMACTMANKSTAIEYDEEFYERASYNEGARWDLINDKVSMVNVGPHAKSKSEMGKPKPGLRHDTPQRVCWEYNQEKCSCRRCTFKCNCDTCFGPHPRLSCSGNGSQPFQSSWSSSNAGGEKEAGSGYSNAASGSK